MKARKLADSFNYAIKGLIYCLKTQRNLAIHLCVAIGVIAAAMILDFSAGDLLWILAAIGLVLIAEIFNTSIEACVDLVVEEYHPKAEIAKNVAASAVLITVMFAVLIGFVIFRNYIFFIYEYQSIFLALGSLVISVIFIKACFGRDKFLSGGMPSGHTAIAFSLTTATYYMGRDLTVTFLAFIMALLVAQSRLEAGVHNFAEISVGAGFGVGVTVLIFYFV